MAKLKVLAQEQYQEQEQEQERHMEQQQGVCGRVAHQAFGLGRAGSFFTTRRRFGTPAAPPGPAFALRWPVWWAMPPARKARRGEWKRMFKEDQKGKEKERQKGKEDRED